MKEGRLIENLGGVGVGLFCNWMILQKEIKLDKIH